MEIIDLKVMIQEAGELFIKKDISGKAVFRIYPFNEISTSPGEVSINFIRK